MSQSKLINQELEKLYGREDAPFRFHKGVLQDVRPDNLRAFLAKYDDDRFELAILLAGLRAWVICPDIISRTVHVDCPESESAEFVQGAMSLASLRYLAQALDVARTNQLIKMTMTPEALIGHPILKLFPWDMFFLLGGAKPQHSKLSEAEFALQLENQKAPVLAAATLLYKLHDREEKRKSDPKIKAWGINAASKESVGTITEAVAIKITSAETVKNYWDRMKRSAAFIYAATMVDNGRLLRWLLNRDDPYDNEKVGPDTFLSEWFLYTELIAQKLMAPLDLLPAEWRPLEPRPFMNNLPKPLPLDEFERILQMPAGPD